MPGGLQIRLAAKVAESIIGKPTSSQGAGKESHSWDRSLTPPSRNSDRSKMKPNDSSVGIRLW